MRGAGLDVHPDPQHLHWKYWQERADWPGSRSFVLTDGIDLLAHVAVVPGRLRRGLSDVRVIQMIDWAARRDAAGAGVVLMNHVGRQADFLLAIGGSEQTLKILPLIGYRLHGEVTGYVRPLAPLCLLGSSGGSRWKLGLRLVRSALWSITAPRVADGAWQVHPIGPAEVESLSAVLPVASPNLAVLGRSLGQFRHALACPMMPFGLHALTKASRVAGYFALSYAPRQARLADLWIDSTDPADWRALIQCAVRQSRSNSRIAELAAWSSDPALSRALRDCGFHARFTMPIYLRASAGATAPEQTLGVQMLDTDAYYLYFGEDKLWA